MGIGGESGLLSVIKESRISFNTGVWGGPFPGGRGGRTRVSKETLPLICSARKGGRVIVDLRSCGVWKVGKESYLVCGSLSEVYALD